MCSDAGAPITRGATASRPPEHTRRFTTEPEHWHHFVPPGERYPQAIRNQRPRMELHGGGEGGGGVDNCTTSEPLRSITASAAAGMRYTYRLSISHLGHTGSTRCRNIYIPAAPASDSNRQHRATTRKRPLLAGMVLVLSRGRAWHPTKRQARSTKAAMVCGWGRFHGRAWTRSCYTCRF